MKRNFSIIRLSAFFAILSIFFVACSKEKSGSDAEDAEQQEISKTTSEADAEAEIIFNSFFDDVIGVSDEVGMAGVGIFGRSADGSGRVNACFTVTITHPQGTPFPARVVIDFGPVPCLGPDGHTRKGKIISEYTNRLTVPGAIAVTRFDGFYFDSIHVEGIHRTTNNSTPNTTPPSRQFKLEIIDGKLTKPNGNYTEWNSVRIIKQIEGLITPDFPRDDVFQITGTSRGKVLRGNLLAIWESSITEPLIKRFLCRWIVKGIIRTVRVNSANTNSPWVALLNFGNGQCDNQAVITINGVSHQITLR